MLVQQVLVRALLDQPGDVALEIRCRRHHDVAALRPHHLVGARPVHRALPRKHPPLLIPIEHQHVFEAGDDHGVNRHLDHLPITALAQVAQRRQRGDRGVRAGGEEVEVAEARQGLRVDIAGRRGEPTESGGHQFRREQLRPRPVRPERADAHNHERGVGLHQRLRIERGLGQPAAVDHDVGPADQLFEQATSALVLRVDGDEAAVRGVERVPERAAALRVVVRERSALAQRVSAGHFDADHIGVEVGEQLRAVDRTLVGEVEHPHAGQWAGREIRVDHYVSSP